ncbi:MBL fold metallo-hydrolase [Enterovirga rhinocerotis]|uniref:Glyoxylase-like metal-dependent hydrolase (Beta-lactamase superfamily II) n=1 Tax=Enterovirga rhinocerotis TaxID=1339210 RepID=A0A4R7C5H7_9HYPH|nr:MBL fold metallo-hydrolase [Enterovirga rhinocerotis]TDR93820.1 glyoxylase-like metal-dependent hydrolase (beta-lactamase superfamily II) [Enterovirga rhinocerotis]
MSDLAFDLDFSAPTDHAVQISPLVRRIVAGNASPFTFTGTCSYVVGRGTVAVIDPGPADQAHLDALIAAVSGETVSHIVVTHTHRDHSPGARALREATGAPIVGCSPHRAARQLSDGEANTMEGSGDVEHRPDEEMREGDTITGPGWSLAAVETPGHTANHLAFALAEEETLFSADHVMAWSTTIVGPPDGSMTAFMASLEKLRGRSDRIYWPGHGGPVTEPQRFLRALIGHRRAREASILGRLAAGDRTIAEIVPAIYPALKPALIRAAGLSTFAHLEDLVTRGLARTEGAPQLDGIYEPA